MAATSSIPTARRTSARDADRPQRRESQGGPARELRSAPSVRPRRSLPWLGMSFMSAAIVAALAYLAQNRGANPSGEPGPVPRAALIAPPPTWQPVPGAAPAFALGSGDGKALSVGLAASSTESRRHAAGGREDTLVFGAFGEEGHGRLSLTRGPTERPSERFYVDLVRRAAAAGLAVVRSGQSAPVATKFGLVEVAPVTLSEGVEQACLAFRFAHLELSFGFQGWLCGAGARPVAPDQLACLIDRVTLLNGAEDSALKVLFAQAERRRLDTCAPSARIASVRPSRS